MKFRFAAFRISSMDMKMTMMLRRTSTLATPMAKSIAPMTRNFNMSGCARLCFMFSANGLCSRSACAFKMFIGRTRLAAGASATSDFKVVRVQSFFDFGGRQLARRLHLLDHLRVNVGGGQLLLRRAREQD